MYNVYILQDGYPQKICNCNDDNYNPGNLMNFSFNGISTGYVNVCTMYNPLIFFYIWNIHFWFRYFVKENSNLSKVERDERLVSVLCEGEFIFLQGRERKDILISVLCEGEFIFFKRERDRLISVLCEGEFIFLQGRERGVTDFGTLWRRILIFFKEEREEWLISVLC